MDMMPHVQIIHDDKGQPAFVVIPYADYIKQRAQDKDGVPHEVARMLLVDDVSPARAWREHLGLTQKEVASRLGISQPAYAEQENGKGRMRKATREKLAAAFGISPALLDI
ncbi:helix-turn-helix domain-containing protein [Cupriavidus plantarum]|uniref:helix-turn-helix domain-containing protein n=1 Tax=Cupriavidus plantarum TaxID=942865 RepID=UPI001B116633|nr:helix-turn-helix transcriptional regulator [Cupriavidus plantarum]CAG2147600.1 hypothetical protein LMG26296_04156 [Cupriavidus plantarum]SMR85517.1 transcriptional regulator [Cupriavidus plantarum]